ncbi:hypothetical protein [Olleya sp. YS]|uniref:hypothetical protein n=1 Tax=Olleya sp. YS TaxID=3028318 RepID=UPI00243429B5|nr:hypothetical protein [Olleya sp. YS]WGD34316.1 hypothetical protein Ollyesu_11065 [Olleya sp. YS]
MKSTKILIILILNTGVLFAQSFQPECYPISYKGSYTRSYSKDIKDMNSNFFSYYLIKNLFSFKNLEKKRKLEALEYDKKSSIRNFDLDYQNYFSKFMFETTEFDSSNINLVIDSLRNSQGVLYDFTKYISVLKAKKAKKKSLKYISIKLDKILDSVQYFINKKYNTELNLKINLIESERVDLHEPKDGKLTIYTGILRNIIKKSLVSFLKEQEIKYIVNDYDDFLTPIIAYNLFDDLNDTYYETGLRNTITDYLYLIEKESLPKFYYLNNLETKKLLDKTDIWSEDFDDYDSQIVNLLKNKIDNNLNVINKYQDYNIPFSNGFYLSNELGMEDPIVDLLLYAVNKTKLPPDFQILVDSLDNEEIQVSCIQASSSLFLYNLMLQSYMESELTKMMVFLISHEIYHAERKKITPNSNPKCEEEEYLADIFALEVYLKFLQGEYTSRIAGKIDYGLSTAINDFIGKPINQIFDNYFFESTYYENRRCYPDVPIRVAEMNKRINESIENENTFQEFKKFKEMLSE